MEVLNKKVKKYVKGLINLGYSIPLVVSYTGDKYKISDKRGLKKFITGYHTWRVKYLKFKKIIESNKSLDESFFSKLEMKANPFFKNSVFYNIDNDTLFEIIIRNNLVVGYASQSIWFKLKDKIKSDKGVKDYLIKNITKYLKINVNNIYVQSDKILNSKVNRN